MSLTLATYLIVKDESKLITRALDSARECDEIVVCDTGSTDDTREVVGGWEQGRVRLVEFAWCDHFAAARNAALDAVTADWCLILDADEQFAPGTIPAVRSAIAEAEAAGIQSLRFECMGENSTVISHTMVRAHRRDPAVRWRGRVHETVSDDSNQVAPGCRLIYGYSPSHDLDPDRNIRLLRMDLEDDPNDTRAMFYLGREHWYRQEFAEAAVLFERRVQVVGNKPECADAWLYLSRCRHALEDWEGARMACLAALALNANFKEALHWMAALSFPGNARAWHRYADLATNEGVLFVRIP